MCGGHKGSQGARPPNRNASNDEFVWKKAIVASHSPIDLLLVREDFCFVCFFGFHLMFGTKLALRSVKIFFLWSLPNFCDKISPSIREDLFLFLYVVGWAPQSEIELQLHFGPPPNQKS